MNTISSRIIQFSKANSKEKTVYEYRTTTKSITIKLSFSFTGIVGEVRKIVKKLQKMAISWQNHGNVWGLLMTEVQKNR